VEGKKKTDVFRGGSKMKRWRVWHFRRRERGGLPKGLKSRGKGICRVKAHMLWYLR
jgi:hypothetical protein